MTKKTPLRVAIIGTGFGVRTQLPAFRRAGGWEVVSLTGSDPERTGRLAREHGVPHACTDLDGALDRGDPDLVSVASTPRHHVPRAGAALAAGRHGLLEKPMALDASEASRLAK